MVLDSFLTPTLNIFQNYLVGWEIGIYKTRVCQLLTHLWCLAQVIVFTRTGRRWKLQPTVWQDSHSHIIKSSAVALACECVIYKSHLILHVTMTW